MWVYHFDHCMKLESTMHWKKGAPKKQIGRQQKLVDKLLLITFFNYQWIIYQHRVLTTQPSSGVYVVYCTRCGISSATLPSNGKAMKCSRCLFNIVFNSVVKKIDTDQQLSISLLLLIIEKKFEIINLNRFLRFFYFLNFFYQLTDYKYQSIVFFTVFHFSFLDFSLFLSFFCNFQ